MRDLNGKAAWITGAGGEIGRAAGGGYGLQFLSAVSEATVTG